MFTQEELKELLKAVSNQIDLAYEAINQKIFKNENTFLILKKIVILTSAKDKLNQRVTR